MVRLKFGIIWTIFVSAFFCIMPFVSSSERIGWFLILMFLEAIGVYIITAGAKQVIKDKKTEKYGSLAYGKILSIHRTGTYINNVPELAAEIAAYIPEEKNVKIFSEITGIGNLNYRVGMYLLLKNFENDVNIVQIIQETSMPFDALESINKMENIIKELYSQLNAHSAIEKPNSLYHSDQKETEENSVIRY